ncbi:T9SS type A sorting domain-containing protein [bacterium]|nr:T9SS type A sorting domain-containing protein [bacterium]MBU1982820.1 T9SS type A sorting domain-containing protein [bacterium]
MRRIVMLCLTVAAFCWLAQAAPVPISLSGSTTPSVENVKSEPPEPGTRPRVHGNSLDEGGETCATAVAITGLPFNEIGYTCDNNDDYDEACPYTGSTSPDVVYSYAPTAEQWVTFNLCNSYYDTKLYIYQDVCQSPPIACNDDACSDPQGNPYRSRLECVHLLPGHTYYIVVDGYDGDCGEYVLDVTDCGPPAPMVCSANSIFSQPPVPPDDPAATAYVSDFQYSYRVYDNFREVTTPICDLHWWGLTAIWQTNHWAICNNEDPMTFAIDFWATNSSGLPGALVCSDTVRLNRQPTGLTYGAANFPLWYWSTTLDPCCTLNAGWISIQGVSTTTPNCAFMWARSLVGNDTSYIQHPTGAMQLLEGVDFAFCLTPGQQEEMDMGDIVHPLNAPFGYPTQVANPGHVVSGIAWLGAGISAEPIPNTFDADLFDDGVAFPAFMIPCQPTQVTVTVTAGPNYATHPLFLNAWKDGNDDGDFCDTLCPVAGAVGTPEWIIQDAFVYPGVHTFTFIDPGLTDVPPYTGWFRFRLTGVPIGPLGFGLNWPQHCPGTFGVDQLGEVEDYWFEEYQLAVELNSFDAIAGSGEVTLKWETASETDNDFFELSRNGTLIRRVPTQGNSAAGHTYTFVDTDLENDLLYTYSLSAVDLSGARQELATASATPYFSPATITEYALYQNYPNPFNPTTQIAFDLAESGNVNLTVYNMTGQLVTTLVSGGMEAGHHAVNFDGSLLPSGTYWYRLTAGEFSAVKKMLLMK